MHILKASFFRWLVGKRYHIHKNDLFQTRRLNGQTANVGKIFNQARCFGHDALVISLSTPVPTVSE